MDKPILAETDIPGWSSGNELALLGSLARRTNGGTIVELGTFAGRTASIMAKNAPEATVHCVDPWGEFDIRDVPEDSLVYMGGDIARFRPGELYPFFLSNVEDCPNVRAHRGLSTEVPWDDMPPADLLFVDADHDTEPLLADLRTWWPRMSPQGLVVGHDWQMQTVRDALIRFLGELNERGEYPQLINFPGVSIWGLMLGLEHAKRWGMDFTGIFPYGDADYIKPRPLEEVQAAVAEAVENGQGGDRVATQT